MVPSVVWKKLFIPRNHTASLALRRCSLCSPGWLLLLISKVPKKNIATHWVKCGCGSNHNMSWCRADIFSGHRGIWHWMVCWVSYCCYCCLKRINRRQEIFDNLQTSIPTFILDPIQVALVFFTLYSTHILGILHIFHLTFLLLNLNEILS